jgi:dTDP-4-amino-4,6-dideoxygalactose transaminase
MRKAIDTVEEFWHWNHISECRAKCNSSSFESFKSEFAKYIGVDYSSIHLTPSGGKAIELLLKSVKTKNNKVMMPAFNCSVVRLASEEAGFQCEFYDFSNKVGVFDWGEVVDQMKDVGVLIVTHYFGVPVDFRQILDYCSSQGIIIIEDCAHTLGGKIDSKTAGTLSDAAIFSFNYDKPISLGWGGIAMINNHSRFDINQKSSFKHPTVEEEMELLQDFCTVMASRRSNISSANSLSFRVLKKIRFLKSSNFTKPPLLSIGLVQAELGVMCLRRYSHILRKRKFNAQIIKNRIPHKSWPVEDEIEPAWLKQRVNIPNENLMKISSVKLQTKGIRAGNFNWPRLISSIGDQNYPSAMSAAANWIDIPIHQNVNENHLNIILSELHE